MRVGTGKITVAVAAAAAVALAWTASAGANGLGYHPSANPRVPGFAEYTADPGQQNDVRVQSALGGFTTLLLTDRSFQIAPTDSQTRNRCVFLTGTALCQSLTGIGLGATIPTVLNVSLHLGDGNDRAQVDDYNGYFFGGAGDDVLRGSNRPDYFEGGPGGDDFRGGTGPVGAGVTVDRVAYSGAPVGVTITLDGLANDGEPGEGDNVNDSIDRVIGTAFADDMTAGPMGTRLDGDEGDDALTGGPAVDSLQGDDGNDTLTGHAGDDVLIGSNGADELDGGAGADILDGGDGDDRILARDGEVDSVRCGAGFDVVIADEDDSFFDLAACEQVEFP